MGLLASPLPPRFKRRRVTIFPGRSLHYDSAAWRDALVIVEEGLVELVWIGGAMRRFASGDVLWLAGLALRAVRNPGTEPAVLAAVSRRLPSGEVTGLPRDPLAQEEDLLDRARDGDQDAFAQIVEPYRRELHAHCYRMLASVDDAEDALQEAMLRAWRGLSSFAGRSSLRSWLYRIATNTCLDALGRRPKRVIPVDHSPAADPHDGPGVPLVESVWVEPYPDERLAVPDGRAAPHARYEERESVELAFVAALQHLPPRQRAALVISEVLGYSARETAEWLDTTTASVNSALQRARKAVDERLPEQSQQATLRSLGDEQLTEIVESYMDAWERGDVEGVASMLAEDAILTMPPMATWYRGREHIEVFLREFAFAGAWQGDHFEPGARRQVRLVPARASGQVAFGAYRWHDDADAYLPYTLQVLSLRGSEIVELCGFVSPDAFRHFDLPDKLAA